MTARAKRRPQAAAYARNRDFLAKFAQVEQVLKSRLKARVGDRAKFNELLAAFREQNPYWSDEAEVLRVCADVRNLITHQQHPDSGDPVFVSPALALRCRAICQTLLHPEPVARRYRRPVFTIAPETPLADVVREAHKRDFSQFPVLRGEKFRGLITENRITRWLGSRVSRDGRSPDIDTVTVLDVLTEQPGEETDVLAWARADTPVDEVMALFCRPEKAELEVVLLTETGGQGSPCGIVTTWDAARFVHRRGIA